MGPGLTLVVLAAGFGSRYGKGEGKKQLEGVGPSGETLLEYSIFDAVRSGFSNIVLVIRREAAADFHDPIARITTAGIRLSCAYQDITDLPQPFSPPASRRMPWGTGHALLAARTAVTGPFVVVNADDFYGSQAYATAASFLAERDADVGPSHLGIVAFPLGHTLGSDAVNRGICRVSDGMLVGVDEHKNIARDASGEIHGNWRGERVSLADDSLASMNFWILRNKIFAAIESEFEAFLESNIEVPSAEFFLPSALTSLIGNGTADCRVLRTADHWFGMTALADRGVVTDALSKLAAAGEYPIPLYPPS